MFKVKNVLVPHYIADIMYLTQPVKVTALELLTLISRVSEQHIMVNQLNTMRGISDPIYGGS